MKFSEWFRNQVQRQDDVGIAANKWNLVTPVQRKGRINAARLVRVAGIPEHTAIKVIQEFASVAA